MGHLLHPARHHESLHSGKHPHGREVHRRKTRSAEAVERNTRDDRREIRIQHCHPGQVQPLFALLGGHPSDYIVNVGHLDAGTLTQRAQDRREQTLRVGLRERSAWLTEPTRCSDCINDPDLVQKNLLKSTSSTTLINYRAFVLYPTPKQVLARTPRVLLHQNGAAFDTGPGLT